ncbi:MAG TPA: glutamyl-tRNA reductase [Candidatus Sulfotelmatobacter sp.]|nr:glutamyl-tRNA reductase [Candidatus Sulfotelmatobacter sp.]
MEIFVLGLSHKTAPIAVRERLHVPERDLPKVLELLGAEAELAERMLLATCNRMEVYGVTEEPLARAAAAVTQALATFHNLAPAEFSEGLHTRSGAEAVRHIFRVAASLDSLVVGEPQILGQVKAAYAAARAQAATGVLLGTLVEQAFHVAKRVRSETGIATAAVSVSSAAVELARKIFDDLSGRTVLIIGAGEMAELALRHLMDDGVKSILVANRSYDRALALAEQFDGRAVTFEGLRRELVAADIVISSTSAPHYVVKREELQGILHERRHRPMFLIDIANPRDVEPACNELDNVYLYNIDDLQAVVSANLREREREAERAEAIVQREVAIYLAWLQGLEVVPTIVSLRKRVEEIRNAELEKALGRMGDLTPEQRQAVAALTSAMVNKILHQPMTELKRRAIHADGHLYSTVLRRLFGLETGHGPRVASDEETE